MPSPQKHRFTISGIYRIIDQRNGYFYIGSAKNLHKRERDHFRLFGRNEHHNSLLQNIYNKYGKDNLVFKVLFICDVGLLLYYEQLCIDKLNPKYNFCRVAGSILGTKLSEETKRKIGLANKGRTGHVAWNKGIPLSEETKKKISAKLIGRPANGRPVGIPHTEEYKKRMSNMLKGIPKPNGFGEKIRAIKLNKHKGLDYNG